MSIEAATDEYAWPSIRLDKPLLLRIMGKIDIPGNQYLWGGKVPDDADSSVVNEKGVDCSGLVRYLIARGTSQAVKVPHGSVNQHDWFKQKGFKRSTVEAAKLKDGVVRVAVMSPEDGGGIGHIALVLDGETMESHGGAGPDRRPWTGLGWQAKARIYVLTAPGA